MDVEHQLYHLLYHLVLQIFKMQPDKAHIILMLAWFWAKDWKWWLVKVCSNLNRKLIKYFVLSLLYNESIWNVLPSRLNEICNIIIGWIQLWTICQTRVVPQLPQCRNWCDRFPFFQYTAQWLITNRSSCTVQLHCYGTKQLPTSAYDWFMLFPNVRVKGMVLINI